MSHVPTAIVATKTVILLLGALITYLALKAYRRTGSSSLRALAIGFGVVTLGAVMGGVAHQALGVSLSIGVLVESLLTALGFAIIVYSLYTE